MPRVAIALGSNLGDRAAHLNWAVEQLAASLTAIRVSAVVETEPLDVPDIQPPYLNAVVIGDTELSAAALMAQLASLEQARGRRRTSFRGARTLDLDLILFGDEVIDTPTLTVPHPRFRERRFVLEALASLEPGWLDPTTGKTVTELLGGLRG